MKNSRRRFGVMLVWILLGGGSLAQSPEPQGGQPADEGDGPAEFQLAVQVELVNVTATVLDNQNRYVENLTEDNFKIFENGVEQQIAFFSHDQDVPVSLGILIDTSGSMRHKLQQTLQVARELAMSLSAQDEVFIVTFSDENKVLTGFTTSGPQLPEVFRGVRSGGETSVYDAVGLGLEMMGSAKNDKKILLLITDGFDTRSELRADDIDELLKRNQVLVYAVGMDDDDSDPEAARRARYHVYEYMLTQLTDITGGRAYRLYTGRRFALRSLAEILLEELHQQYTLSYYPSGGIDENWREIQVNLDRPEATIRYRGGYYMQLPGNRGD